jgi:hypothetical protein
MKKRLFLVLLLGLFLVMFTFMGCKEVPVEKQCSVDEDCVKDVCCHASDAVNVIYGPDCSGIFCTSVCAEGTTDCGQGELKCKRGECQVVLKENIEE